MGTDFKNNLQVLIKDIGMNKEIPGFNEANVPTASVKVQETLMNRYANSPVVNTEYKQSSFEYKSVAEQGAYGKLKPKEKAEIDLHIIDVYQQISPTQVNTVRDSLAFNNYYLTHDLKASETKDIHEDIQNEFKKEFSKLNSKQPEVKKDTAPELGNVKPPAQRETPNASLAHLRDASSSRSH